MNPCSSRFTLVLLMSGAPEGLAVSLTGPTAGGTDKTVTVVSQADIDKAYEQLEAQDSNKVKTELKKQFDKSIVIIEESFAIEPGDPSSAPAVGQEATTRAEEMRVVGRGVTVGRPLGLLLTRRTENATVTLCHTGTKDLAAEVQGEPEHVVTGRGLEGIRLVLEPVLKLLGVVADSTSSTASAYGPRPGGLIAALDAAPEADVVLVAHTGLDHLLTVADLWRELPMDKQIIMRWWQVPRAEIPESREQRIDWLYGWWERIDDWVQQNRPEDLSSGRLR